MRRSSAASAVMAVVLGLVATACSGESTVDSTIPLATTSTLRPTTLAPTASAARSSLAEPSRASIFDFPTADDVAGWRVVNDTVMGGVSTGDLAWDNGALVFTGELSLDNNGGFASVRSPFVDPSTVEKWTDRATLRVEARGGGRVWTVEVRMAGDDGGWVSKLSTSAGKITAVELPWATFEPVTRFLDPREPAMPLDPTSIVSVAFYLVDGIEGPFRLELRSIS